MPSPDSQAVNWSGTGKLRGGRKALRFFLAALRVLGPRATSLLTWPVAAYYSAISPDIPSTMEYHRRVFGPMPRWKRRWMVLRHFQSFGQAIIDRLAVLGGQTECFAFTFEGEHYLREAVAEGRGVLLLTAHVGNWEAAGHLLSRLNVPINVTGFDNESAEIRSMLNEASQARFRLLPLTGSPTDTIPLVAALRRGEVVAMLGDRAYGSPVARISFLDGTASFPIGAYVMAAVAGAPLVHVFNLREPGGRYHCFGFPPQRPRLPPRQNRDAYLEACVKCFARDLETILRKDPLQWYNFYPFWETSELSPSTAPESQLCPTR